jgi:HD-GYP domain-containing protein (c-di-GMP phosphodiesterase class II)
MEALMHVLESTIAARDPYTVGHQRRVSQIACTIGREMGLSEDRLHCLRVAGILHDLGKIAIPSDLLSKPGKLTATEFALVKTHPQVAYNILSPISLPGNTAKIILQHHERINGSGYPQGLQGEDILLEARILGVADVMEAMCSHRPYRASLGLAETLNELTRNKGILYDGAVVDACLKLYGQDMDELPEVCSDSIPLSASMPAPPVPREEGAPVHEIIARGRPVPEVEEGKKRNWARLRTKGRHSWTHLSTAFIMGWLIMASVRGF